MSTFVKKATSAVAGLAVVFSMVSPIAGVSAALSGVEAANQLATLGVVVDQSANPADYRLGDNLPRKEAVKVMMNLSSVAVVDNCSGQFSDLTSADWACKYAETALANGLVAANASFRPDDLVSKIEALKMVFQGMDLERNDNADWRAGYVDAAVSMGIASSFSDYDTPATRAEMFIWAAEAINMDEEVATEDPLCDLLGICPDSEEDTDQGAEEAEGEVETPVAPAGSSLQVSLSPSTPAATTIPGRVNGLAAAAFDFTAGSSDVTVSQVSVKRNGLSDEETLDSLAIFTDAGRVSNAKSDNQDNDTTAQINLDNGGVVVEAGETVTMVVVVDVNAVAETANDEFALSISDVSANADVTGLGVQGATMKIGSVDAPQITFDESGSVSDPNLGEVAADIFEFEIQGDNDEDVMVESITFEGSSDAEDDLRNFELLMGNKVVATTAMMTGDYLTFDVDGLLIEEDKNEDFTVRADVIDGAGDEISFSIDAKLDVTANSTKFGFGAGVEIAVSDFGEIEIQAGELTFIEVESEIEEIREDKDNVVLATFEIVNLSGNDLELEDFATLIEMTGSATLGTESGTGTVATVNNVFDEVELYNMETGSSYELDTTDANPELFEESGVDAVIGEGTTTWMIRADTAEDIADFDNLSFNVSINLDDSVNDIVINETMDDERVTDITPSSLTFDTIDGSESGASVNVLSLSPTLDVVRGAKEVIAFEFEVEAEEVSSLIVDELTVQLTATGGANATKQQISLVNLYLGSVSSANLLDGDSLSNEGEVTFDDMGDVMIPANGRQTFVVTVDVVDGTDAVDNTPYTTALTAISIEDDENDDIDVAVLPVSNRSIVVTNSGEIATLVLDTANEDNEFNKLGLAGDSTIIASWDVRANNETIDVETVEFALASVTDSLANTVSTADILLNGSVVGTASNSDIVTTGATATITFDDLSELILPETTGELALRLNTSNIGRNLVGVAQTGLFVTAITLADAEGEDSGKDVDDVTATANSTTLDVVSAIVTPSVVSTFGQNDTVAEVRLVVDGGNNTTATGDAVQAEFVGFNYQWTAPSTPTVENSNGVIVSGSDSIGNNNEVYTLRIDPVTASNGTYTLDLNAVEYTINGTDTTGATSTAAPFATKLKSTLELGEYTFSN